MKKISFNKALSYSLGSLLFAISFSSCKKFVQVPPPQTQVVTATVFNNDGAATSAQLGIYTYMWTSTLSYNIAANMGTYADELASNSTTLIQQHIYNNAILAADNYTPGEWNIFYSSIFDSNSVISGLQNTVGTSTAVRRQLMGEALFVRAFCHSYLASIYGDVPIVLSIDPNVNATIPRSPRTDVWRQAVSDLQNAKNLLNSNYVDGSDTTINSERVRPTKAVALALLARVYLYLGDYTKDATYYAKADSAASAVISNSTYSLSPIGGVFLKNSNEAIWQLQTPSAQIADTYDGDYFILTGAPGTGSQNSNTISPQLMASFEANDQRKTSWIGSINALGNTYYFPYKYKNRTLLNQEYTMVLRLGEQYLIRAEARNHEGNINGALADLNAIRIRAGLPSYAGATDATSLASAILHERQVELFTEWGHRWFDLARTGNAPAVMTVVTPQKGGSWYSNNYQLVFPIPQQDRDRDQALTQNPGY